MLKRFFSGKNAAKQQPPAGQEFAVGNVLEQRFEIEAIRRGYMGIVYITYDRQIRRRVVLKTFQNKFLWNDEAIQRFNAEAELWMRLGGHSNIVRALDLRTFLGKPHVVAEYVHGGPMRMLIGHLSFQEAVDYAIQICLGMAYSVSQAAIMHRDLKPDNILVTFDGQAKVTDFGLAKVLPRWQWEQHQLDPRSVAMRMKHPVVADVLSGTLPYMAPEMFSETGNIGPWTDIYAFGVMLYEMLTGRLPFDSLRDESLVRMHMRSAPPDPRVRKPDLPPDAVQIVMRCLAKRITDRYDSWTEVEDALQDMRKRVFGREFIATWPDDDIAESERLVERGQTYMRLGEFSDAKSCFQRATTYDRANAYSWTNLAQAQLHGWEYREALMSVDEGLRRAVSRNEFGQLFGVRGQVYTTMRLADQALEAFDEGLSYTPNSPMLWRERGKLQLALGELRNAQQCAERAIEYDRLDPQGWLLLGDVQFEQGRSKKAFQAFEEAKKLAPRDPNVWIRYGFSKLRDGKAREALTLFEMAIKLDPENAAALDGARRARHALG